MGGVTAHRRVRRLAICLAACFVLAPAVPASATETTFEATDTPDDLTSLSRDPRVRALAQKQLDELGIPRNFLPFLRDDQSVQTGKEIYGDPVPDLNGDGTPEVLETNFRYSYSVNNGQSILPVDSETDTRIVVRSGTTGRKIWSKRYHRDAWPMALRVGDTGHYGVVVISGLWNFFGTTEENTLTFDAFEGKRGKHLWRRNYESVTSYEGLTTVSHNAPLIVASFDALKGRADDLMFALADTAGSWLAAETMAVRTVVIDGRDGSEHAHPTVDVGVGWWPIPLPTKDLDGDGLEDYATTNNLGLDPGGSQSGPTIGGTVYTRKGTDGSSIWITSGLEMELFAFTTELPDVVADRTPDVRLETYVEREGELLPIPINIPLLGFTNLIPRAYLFDGRGGVEAWHKPWEWIYSPGDIDDDGKRDLVLFKYRWQLRNNRTIFEQLALDGPGHTLWHKSSIWNYEGGPCRHVCSGNLGLGIYRSFDVQPDRIDDVLLYQEVRQNQAFEDRISRVFNGRTGEKRFEDDVMMHSPEAAIDGHGDDLLAVEKAGNKVSFSARSGSNRVLWTGLLGGPDKIVPRNSWFWGSGLVLPGDRCADLVINGFEGQETFYGVFSGRDGRLMWWRWTGAAEDHPTFTERKGEIASC